MITINKFTEMVGWEGLPPPAPVSHKIWEGTQIRKKSTNRVFDKNVRKRPLVIGDLARNSIRERRLSMFRNQPGFASYLRSETPDGMSKDEAKKMWDEARRLAKRDVEMIKKVMPDIDDMGLEALEAAATVMRSPLNQEITLKAAKIILEYTRAKPASKSEVTVQSTEAWLDALAAAEAAEKGNE